MKIYGEWRYSSTFLNLITTWRRAVRFTPLPFHPQTKSPRYPLDKRSQSWSVRCGEENNFAPPGNRTRAVQPVARRYIFNIQILAINIIRKVRSSIATLPNNTARFHNFSPHMWRDRKRRPTVNRYPWLPRSPREDLGSTQKNAVPCVWFHNYELRCITI
jgi:hypothetical protein